ncbi:ABC transporter ATP-binding protein [Telmatobacter bradus]|uniref:ABC transporter ATP-binding protein n=1 Tax=Telmatobacter bradus TaxID=474953 RepID=UPI003B42D1BA
MTKKTLIRVEEVSRRFALDHTPGKHTAATFVSALHAVNLTVSMGDFLAISGPSGSGKSTLLNLIGCIDKPSSGAIFLDGVNTTTLNPEGQSELRRNKIGFVFQTFNLIPVFTAAENVEYPLLIQGVDAGERRRRVADALENVGLAKRAQHRPDLLSGGERQRVAVARAIVHRPALVLADEPTANLDTQNATQLIALMQGLNQRMGLTFIFSTHDARLLEHTPRIVRLCDGRIESQASVGEAGGNAQHLALSNVELNSMEGVHHV